VKGLARTTSSISLNPLPTEVETQQGKEGGKKKGEKEREKKAQQLFASTYSESYVINWRGATARK